MRGHASAAVAVAERAAARAPGTDGIEARVYRSIAEIPQAAWDALLDEQANPFVRWHFLEALEHAGCVSPRRGWHPFHLTLWRDGALVAAAPCYALDSSEGDFSRDWGWADGAQRAGVRYYPKLAITVPFTPATGRRFLVAAGEDRAAATAALLVRAIRVAEAEGCSGLQVLYPLAEEAALLESLGMTRRIDIQYHWTNPGYRTPDEFLARFDSKRRNQLKRERAAPAKQGITIRTLRAADFAADPRSVARAVHALHRSTVDKLMWGRGWLNAAFYERIFERMPDALEVVEARRDGRLVAGAFNVASRTHLYGRYWGCHEEHPFLHFNVCLYHSIDECIARGLRVFEGGAGGEHKIARGFEPVETHGAHLFLDPRLDEAVRLHLRRENRALEESLANWRDRAPILKKSGPSQDGSE